MFPKMRRTKQGLSLEECRRILREGTSGVLALAPCRECPYPYAVPLSYVYLEDESAPESGVLAFHCSHKGHKIEALKENHRVSFCVIDKDEVVPEEFATHYKSVIAFGRVRFVSEDSEKRAVLAALGDKYSPGLDAEAREEIDKLVKGTCVVSIEIEHLSGKQAKGLVG